jgi:hypothetical protein
MEGYPVIDEGTEAISTGFTDHHFAGKNGLEEAAVY